jgi:protein ImuA
MDDGFAYPIPAEAFPRGAFLEGGATERLVSLGAATLDAALGGGLARGRLHEILPRGPGDAIAGVGFAAMLAARLEGEIFWLRESGSGPGALYPPGFAEIGLDPARLILASLPDPAALLKAAADAARCAGVGVLIASLRGNPRALDLAATRRLALAAERSGATVLLLRPGAREGPSAARTRWGVAAAPSTPFEGRAPGLPTLMLDLLRRRGGPPAGPWVMEWDRAERSLRAPGAAEDRRDGALAKDRPPLSGAVLSPAAKRQDPPARRIA